MTFTMYDSVDPGAMPKDGDYYAAYVDHDRVNGFSQLPHYYPGKQYVSISNNGNDADVLDVESGSATVQTMVKWIPEQFARGKLPTVYCDESTWPGLRAATKVQPSYWWIAKYNDSATMIPGAIAHQFEANQGHAQGLNYDTSIVGPGWVRIKPKPTPPPEDDDMTPEQEAQLADCVAGIAAIQHALGLIIYGDSEDAALNYGGSNKPPQGHPWNLYQIWNAGVPVRQPTIKGS